MKLHILLRLLPLLILLNTGCKTQRLFEPSAQSRRGDWTELLSFAPYRLRPDDKISLSVWDHEELSVGSIYGVYNSNEVYGKWLLVDAGGDLLLPKTGKLHVDGLTVAEATDAIAREYARLIPQPVITLKVLNKEVTVLGEVKSPGMITLEKERNSLVEVLGRAGGPDYYAKADRVQVLRTRGQQRVEYEVDLTRLSTLEQESLWVEAGDILYVPPQKRKSLQKESSTLVPFAAILSSLAVVLTVLNK
jgi:polysaccharide export outer membrane protein